MHQQKYAKLSNGAFIRVTNDNNNEVQSYIDLKTTHSKLYAAYILMNKDLDLVLQALSQVTAKDNSNIISQSLSFFAIITYAKCFTKNKGRGTSLNVNDVFKNSSEDLLAEHLRIMALRNDYVAHAGAEYEKCAVTATLYQNMGTVHLEGNLAYVTNIEPKIDTFIELCKYLQDYINKKTNIFQMKIFEYLQSLTYEELMSLSIKPDIDNLYVLIESEENDGSYKFEKHF